MGIFLKIIALRPEWAGTKRAKDGKDIGWNVEDDAIRIVMTGTASDAANYQDQVYSKGQKKRLTNVMKRMKRIVRHGEAGDSGQ